MKAPLIRALRDYVLPEIGSNAVTATVTFITAGLGVGSFGTIIVWLGEEVPFWTIHVLKELWSARRPGFL